MPSQDCAGFSNPIAASRASAPPFLAGGVQKPGKVNLAQDPAGTLGIDKGGFGFSKQNELTVGRVVSVIGGSMPQLLDSHFCTSSLLSDDLKWVSSTLGAVGSGPWLLQ